MKILTFIMGAAGFSLLYSVAWQAAIGVLLVTLAIRFELLLEEYK